MSDNPSHYDVLGVHQDASPEQIIDVYHDKAKECHTDKNLQESPQISNEKMQAVNVACNILRDPMKRVEYDAFEVATGGNDQFGGGLEQTTLRMDETTQIEKGGQSEKGKDAPGGTDWVNHGSEQTTSPLEDIVQTEKGEQSESNEAGIVPVPVNPTIQSEIVVDESMQAVNHGPVGNPFAISDIEESEEWFGAIESGDCNKLKQLLSKDTSYLWKYEKEGRTALRIAMGIAHYKYEEELADLILDELLKVQRQNKTCLFFQVLNPASEFDSVYDYIQESMSYNQIWCLTKNFKEKRRCVHEDGISRAIEQRDWATLLNVFSKPSVLIEHMKHSKAQRSVLHVAAMYGCFPLVAQLFNMVTSKIYRFKREKVIIFIMMVDPETQLTALQMADDIIGNKSISEFIKFMVRLLKSSKYSIRDFSANLCKGLFEAYPHTQWHKELKMYIERSRRRGGWIDVDSAMLQQSLQRNSRLLLEAFHGLSALHLAIIFGDKKLVDAIKALFGPQGEIVWGVSYYPQALSWGQMCKAKGVDGEEFNRDIFDQIELDLLPYYSISARRIERIYFNDFDLDCSNSGEVITTLLPEQSLTFSAINDYIHQEWDVNHEEWQKGFEADMDFNFEVEPRKSLLRVHHACKDPMRFQQFLESVSKHENFNDFSTRMHDAKGRTIHHILLDDHTTDKSPGWAYTKIFPLEVSKFCIEHAQDLRGRRLMDALIMKNHLQCNTTLEPYPYFNMEFENDATRKDGHSTSFGTYYVACALQQTIIASQPIWVEVLRAHLTKLKTLKLLSFATAASTNQMMLQALSRIEPQVDLMIRDEKERTLLHYAADPTSLKFETLLDMASDYERSLIYTCFSTVQDYCEFRKKSFPKNDAGFNSKDQSSRADDEKDETTQSNVRRRACILMLLQAGLDLSQQDDDRKVPSLGPTSDATYQTWWYDLVVKDATDNKNSFNQAGNALSVVGTLVAATSYIGPLQPPMSYTDGLVRHSEKLVEVFMVTNTLAFFLAMASVMFAVVPSLPMPRESVMSELNRARRMVSLSLCLLLVAIVAIIISFSAASVVVNQYEYSFPRSNKLLGPLLAGWSICLIAVASFFIRILRLSFYDSVEMQRMYQFSGRKFCMRVLKSYFSFLVRDYRCLYSTLDDSIVFSVIDSLYFSWRLDRSLLNMSLMPARVGLVIFSMLLFPIYHVFRRTIVIPCGELFALCARFRRQHKHGDRNSDDDYFTGT